MDENYTINHEMQNYDYAEGIEFKGLVPQLMEIEGIKTVGKGQLEVPSFVFCSDNEEIEDDNNN